VEKIRTVFSLLWRAKERIVFLAMLVFLGVRIYNVINPEDLDDNSGGNSIFAPPRTELSEEVDRPGAPPRVPLLNDPEDWSPLLRRNPFQYEQRTVSAGGNGEPLLESEIKVLSIQEAIPGVIKVQIQTATTKQWYEEGEQFERYTLQEIDVEAQCCRIYDESLGRAIDHCVGDNY